VGRYFGRRAVREKVAWKSFMFVPSTPKDDAQPRCRAVKKKDDASQGFGVGDQREEHAVYKDIFVE